MRSGLTVLCITRNQAPQLLRMLQSIQGTVDDMIVVDTGSKDLSPGVARMQGARVFEIEWPGSFSVALNYGLKEVQTEWVLRLDTDEWLEPESRPLLKKLLSNNSAYGYYLVRRDMTDDLHYSESYMFRMWRHHPRLQFQGYIHEFFDDEVLKQVAGKRQVFNAPVRIFHDGFLGGNTLVKMRRNAELLKRELEDRPGQLYYEVDLVLTQILLKEEGALDTLQELTERVIADYPNERPAPFTANLLGTALSNTARRDLESERTRRILDKSWEWFDACPPMLWAIAQTELRRNNQEGVYRALLRLEELGESGEYEKEYTFDGRMLKEGLWEFLAKVADSLGHEEVARRNRERISLSAR